MIAQGAQSDHALGGTCDDHASVAAGAEIFRGIKTEASRLAKGAGGLAMKGRADRLRFIFVYGIVFAGPQGKNEMHVRRQAVKMHDDNGASARRNTILDLPG